MWLKATAGQTPQTDRCRIPYRTPNRSGRQEPMVSRIYVEKKPGFDVEAQQLKGELTEILGIKASRPEDYQPLRRRGHRQGAFPVLRADRL